MKHGWWVHEGDYAFEPKALLARAAKLRRYIKARPEKEVVLVAHGFFNHYITREVNEKGEQTTPWWDEAELRTYRFVDGEAYEGGGEVIDGAEGAAIQETEESLQRLEHGRPSVMMNINRPAGRRESLAGYQENSEMPG